MLAVTSQASASRRMENVERRELQMSSLLAQYAAHRDPIALQAIIEQHAALVYSTCLRVVGDPHLADDAGQAVFLIFTRKAATLRADTPLAAWFYRTSVFVAQRANRERRTRQRYEQEAAAMRAQANQTDDRDRALWAELKPKLDVLLETLPAAERDAIVLRYLAGKTEPEAAQALGCPVGTLSARVSRALAKLRQRFGGSAMALPAAALGLALEQHATHAAPAHFVSSIHAACLGTAGATASVAANPLAEGTMKALFWLKVKVVAAVLLISALIGVPVTMKLAAGEAGPVVKGDKAPEAPLSPGAAATQKPGERKVQTEPMSAAQRDLILSKIAELRKLYEKRLASVQEAHSYESQIFEAENLEASVEPYKNKDLVLKRFESDREVVVTDSSDYATTSNRLKTMISQLQQASTWDVKQLGQWVENAPLSMLEPKVFSFDERLKLNITADFNTDAKSAFRFISEMIGIPIDCDESVFGRGISLRLTDTPAAAAIDELAKRINCKAERDSAHQRIRLIKNK